MAEEPKVGEPLWWAKRLHEKLIHRNEDLVRYNAYYEGRHNLAFATEKFRQAFGSLFSAFADNWCDLVVDAVEERLNVEGFRFPEADGQGGGDITAGDQDAWDIWQENDLDSVSQMVHTDALVYGCSYVLVAPPETRGGEPEITGETAEECITEYAPGTAMTAAGWKEWTDSWTGRLMGTLYLPDSILRYQSDRKVESAAEVSTTVRWMEREGDGDVVKRNPLGVVPLVAFENRPRLRRPGRSEIRTVIPIQDAVNKLCADMIVASEFQAYRQRVLMGVEVPTDPVTNQPIDAFKHAVNRLWLVDNENAKAFEFGEIDLRNFVEAVAMYVQHIASQSRTPPHYFFLRGQFPSGESIKAAETGLVAKTKRKTRFFGEGWEHVMRLAFALKDDPRAKVTNAETIWADPESRTESEHIDAVLKKQALGVPQEQLWEDAGYTPQQIERFKEMQARQAALAPPPTITIGTPNPNGNVRPTGPGAAGPPPPEYAAP